ncbi:hypothetical protein NFI96_013979, partial [Prochilodus magdalenae]
QMGKNKQKGKKQMNVFHVANKQVKAKTKTKPIKTSLKNINILKNEKVENLNQIFSAVQRDVKNISKSTAPEPKEKTMVAREKPQEPVNVDALLTSTSLSGDMSGVAGASALGCSPAGFASGSSGIAARLPSRVLEHIFSYLDLSDLSMCSLVCWHWNNCLADENSEVWRSLCARVLSEEALRSDILCNLPTYKGKLKSFQHALSSHDCSRNVYVKKNGFTLHRNPIAQSTDGARGKIGFTEGRHAWEIWWEGPLGTVAVIGIATKRAPMQCQGYVALLGSDDQSWGWNLVDNNLLHNGEVNGNFPQCNNAPKYQIGERIRVILDMDDKTLAFERGFEFLGVAFRGLPKTCLFPAVSAVYGNTEVTMVYLGKPLDG